MVLQLNIHKFNFGTRLLSHLPIIGRQRLVSSKSVKGGMLLTKNQIEFLKYQETQRNNRELERLTSARDTNTYLIQSAQNVEMNRHNLETERQGVIKLGQDREHYLQDYNVKVLNLQETSRANKAREEETRRSNLATEAETRRANLARETESYRSNVAKENLNYQSLIEQQRSNLERERQGQVSLDQQAQQLSETVRSNRAREAENVRTNMSNEQIRRDQLSESIRSNKANEAIGRTQASSSLQQAQAALRNAESNALNAATRQQELAALNRYREQSVRLDVAKMNESHRTNLAREAETRRSNMANEQIAMQKLEDYYNLTTRQAVESERHNEATEGIQTFDSFTKFASSMGRYIIPLIGG